MSRTLAERIQALAEAHAKETSRANSGSVHWVPGAMSEVVDTRVENERTRVWFTFDFVVLYSVQSGSDSYEHAVYGGTAVDNGTELVDVALECLRSEHVTEHEMEWADQRYDARRVATEARDAWWARIRREL